MFLLIDFNFLFWFPFDTDKIGFDVLRNWTTIRTMGLVQRGDATCESSKRFFQSFVYSATKTLYDTDKRFKTNTFSL